MGRYIFGDILLVYDVVSHCGALVAQAIVLLELFGILCHQKLSLSVIGDIFTGVRGVGGVHSNRQKLAKN